MLPMGQVRDFSKVGDSAPVPNLIELQTASYERFLQADVHPEKRKREGLESLLREIFPIVSYDEQTKLEYLYFELGEARYNPQECRDLRLTYGLPLRIRCRLSGSLIKEPVEESIYVGEIPIMVGGGEFIINGAERVIVSQLHRSPGVDFTVEMEESDRPLHGARIIPERGSWIELSVTKKDSLAMRIDQSSKIPATMFLRAMDEKYGTDAAIIREFYQTKVVLVEQLRPTDYLVEGFVDPDSGEELVPAGGQIGEALTRIVSSPMRGDSATEEDAHGYIKDRIQHKVFPSDFPEQEVPKIRKALTEALGSEFSHRNTKEDLQAILECIEDRLMMEFGPSDNLKPKCAHFPRFNYEGPSEADSRQILQKWKLLGSELHPVLSLFEEVKKGAKEDDGWGNSAKKPGVYIFRDKVEGKIVYVGIAHKQTVSAEVSTQRTSDDKGSSLVKQVLAWLRKSRGSPSKPAPGRKSAGGVEVVDKVPDPLVLNTLSEDLSDSHENALLRIYMRLRPGNPPQVDKAKTLFKEKFYDENRYRLGKVGRFRANRKFHQEVPESVMTLRTEDFVNTLKYLLRLRGGQGVVDDIDHLGNRRLRTIDELATDELRKGFLKLRRTVQERMSLKDPKELSKIAELVNSKSISSSIEYFFGRGELSQVVDQQNPLSQLTHERRLSALGPGGLNRKRAGFEVRDVHISHYGRICPIETPEGNNIGLISSMGIYAGVDDYGFLTTPYRKAEKGKVTDQVVHLRADEEMEAVLAPPDALERTGRGESQRLPKEHVLARVKGELAIVGGGEVDYVDISPRQTVGISAALIPFLEHDDANRALMGSNMQRQAVPLIKTEPPIVATGMEKPVAENSGMVVKARKGGTVTYVDAERIIIDNADEYELRKFGKLNERACLNQKPIVREGQRVKKGQVIADGSACCNGELALGRNVLVAFMPFDGYNFEDAILISERMVKADAFTSVHLEEYDVEVRETKLGREEFTRDIPNVSERALRNLDSSGVVRVGTRVGPGDILVGKVSPKSKSELSPEEKLLHAIFGRAGEDVKNDSLELPAGEEGVVVDTRRFSRRMHMTDEQKKELHRQMKDYQKGMNSRLVKTFRQMSGEINEVLGAPMVDPSTRQKVGQSDDDDVILEQVENFNPKWVKATKPAAREQAEEIYNRYWPRVMELQKEMKRKLDHMKRGDELPSGVLEMVKVRVATKRRLGVGDKMAGRHGNKGVIAKIMPDEDMPFLEDGTPADIVLNPLGVPSRMNVGQILETHLGWAAAVLGFQAITPVFDGATEGEIVESIREANQHIYRRREETEAVAASEELREVVRSYEKEEDDQVLKVLYRRWLTHFKVLYTDEGGRIDSDDLVALEEAMIGECQDAIPRNPDRAHLPRFNRVPKSKSACVIAREHVLSSEKLCALFKLAKASIAGNGGSPWFPATEGSLDLVEKRQGLYFFRNAISGRVNEGYVGLAGKSDQNLRERLRLHFRPDRSVNNMFLSYFKDEAEWQLEKYSSGERMGFREILAEMPEDGKITVFDGRTGEPFEQKVTVGWIYMNKLHHLVDEKIHARATGPYSLITQQPLGGKARTGGQRFGEMEVWGLEAYGASYTLQELLTVKSDDVEGRTKIYESMVKGANTLEAGTPVSFDVLCNELRGLGLNIQLEKKKLI